MRPSICIPLVVVFAASALTAGAQTNDDINSGIEFNFSTPGARSLAMGGAFLGLADDATAAYTNPAGLTNLSVGGSEFSIEFRGWSYANTFSDRGHAFGDPSNRGVDTISGIQERRSESRLDGLSFLSLGYVLPRGWTLALYRHELANFAARLEAQGPIVGSGDLLNGRVPGERDYFRIFPSRSNLDLQVVNYGFSGAFPIRHRLSIGLGLSYYHCDLSSITERFLRKGQDGNNDGQVNAADDPVNRGPGGFFGPPDFLGDNLNNRQTQQSSDDSLGVNVGLLWTLNERWSFGGAYRQGPKFDVQARYSYGPAVPGRPDPTNFCTPQHAIDCVGGRGILHVPDVLGVGVAWRNAGDRAKLTLDYDRVRYSQLTAELINILARSQSANDPESSFRRSDYRIADGGEVHLGFENVVTVGSQVVVTGRLGAWYDPDHKMRYTGGDPVLQARFRPGKDQIHSAGGIGLVFKENFQVDAALDVSDHIKTGSVSLVKFF